jgi:hypothetical protein
VQLESREHRLQHDLHLEQSEARADAPPSPAAERDPRVRARRRLQEALRAERERVGVDRRVVVQQVGAGEQHDAGPILDPADLDRLLDQARLRVRHDRAPAQDLVDRRRQVSVVVAVVELGVQAQLHGRRARDLLEGPRELRSGRLVAGDKRRDELVAHLSRRHRRAVLVARAQQQREHVVAVVLRAALLDQRVDQLVGARPRALELSHRATSFEQALSGGKQRQRALAECEHAGHQVAQLVELRAALEPEDGTQDHLEREPLYARVKRDRLLVRPAGDLALGELGHQAGKALHLLAVERRQQQLALAHVRLLVEQDHRARADHRLEDARALARMQHVGRRGEDLLDLVRVGDHHERRLAEQADREAPAVARAAALEVRGRAAPPADRLQHARRARSGRKFSVHGGLLRVGGLG